MFVEYKTTLVYCGLCCADRLQLHSNMVNLRQYAWVGTNSKDGCVSLIFFRKLSFSAKSVAQRKATRSVDSLPSLVV